MQANDHIREYVDGADKILDMLHNADPGIREVGLSLLKDTPLSPKTLNIIRSRISRMWADIYSPQWLHTIEADIICRKRLED